MLHLSWGWELEDSEFSLLSSGHKWSQSTASVNFKLTNKFHQVDKLANPEPANIESVNDEDGSQNSIMSLPAWALRALFLPSRNWALSTPPQY